jgi:hypothetical protein
MFFLIENNLILFLFSLPRTTAITPGVRTQGCFFLRCGAVRSQAAGRKKKNNFINFKLKYHTASQRNNQINEEFIS